MKKKYALFCILLILGCIWLVKSCESRRVKQPQQTPSNGTNSALHVVTVPKAETTNAVTDLEPVAERSIFPPQWKLSREVEHAMTKGARARATLRVVDSAGKCVPDAQVRLNFMFFERKNNFETGLTDTNGLFSAERDTMSECNWFIEKEGYYDTEGRHSFAANLTNDSVKNGRWQPWNPTWEVVLKEKRKPIPMYTKRVELTFPKRIEVGFDAERGDLVAPYGKGVNTNIIFKYTSTFSRDNIHNITNDITIATYSGGGFIQLEREQYSRKENVYEAPLDGYKENLTFELVRWPGKIIKDVSLPKQAYLVFKTAEIKNLSRFGIICDFEYGECWEQPNYCTVIFLYYFNPTPDDRNLEFDGKNNLFNPGRRES